MSLSEAEVEFSSWQAGGDMGVLIAMGDAVEVVSAPEREMRVVVGREGCFEVMLAVLLMLLLVVLLSFLLLSTWWVSSMSISKMPSMMSLNFFKGMERLKVVD